MEKRSTGKPKKSGKKPGPEKGTGGRPVIEFNPEQAEKLAALQCTGTEIAAFFNMSYDTLANRIREKYDLTFTEWFNIHSAHGKMSLRRKQYEVAMKGSENMLKHLGKHWLDQTDKQTIEQTTSHQIGSYEEFIIARNKEKKRLAEQKKLESNNKDIEEAEIIEYDEAKDKKHGGK